jgi:hypothetical protein
MRDDEDRHLLAAQLRIETGADVSQVQQGSMGHHRAREISAMRTVRYRVRRFPAHGPILVDQDQFALVRAWEIRGR